ncbi:GNAT family N-acetyltransferase [Sphingomonas caeni]|uniref:GNAT family N-acetyltransferase n=1 Tax=Sphingomonas caeni TaxID=2984949 RepID=UPI0022309664|nr:GNAT family N-acetyltransferase [Sphingomonas caeni]
MALNWKRGLTRLALFLATLTIGYAMAEALVAAGVEAGLRAAGSASDRLPSNLDAAVLTADAITDASHWGGPVPALLLIGAILWVGVGFQPGGVSPAAGLGVRARSIRTARLVLRRPQWEDGEAIHAIFSDDETLRYWDRPPYATIEESRQWLERLCALPPETSDVFIIEREGRVIGVIGSMSRPWLTFLLAKGEWRQGYASEALQAFLGYTFGRGVPEVHVATHPDNAASLALLRKAGFEEYARSTGLFKVRGEPGAAVHLKLDAPSAGPVEAKDATAMESANG